MIDIDISVNSSYSPENSNPENNIFSFKYHVSIKNNEYYPVQLISRHWIIQNSNKESFEVKGPGVIGEQPVIEPGDSFSYTSGTEINTPEGVMYGTYQMMTEDVKSFDTKIPKD